MQTAVVVTGVNGGIGAAIAKHLLQQGYAVLGIDLQPETALPLNAYWPINLDKLVSSQDLQTQLKHNIDQYLQQNKTALVALVNNAAVQILDGVEAVAMSDFLLTQKVNVAAPLLLSQLCLPYMKDKKDKKDKKEAVIINIGSIHAELTKPAFISYATSKAAIKGLTQAMAVDLAGEARVNCIEPAAIATEMLLDGFKDTPEKFAELEEHHPSGEIGTPEQVAELCYFLVSAKMPFLNGACIGLNGGIGARLHDPI